MGSLGNGLWRMWGWGRSDQGRGGRVEGTGAWEARVGALRTQAQGVKCLKRATDG